MATRGYPVPEVERTYSRAWALCDQLGRSAELFPVLRGLWNYHLLRGELRQAHDLAQRLVVLAEEQGTPVHRALARRARGTAFVFPRPVRRFMPTSTRNRAGQRPPGTPRNACRAPASHLHGRGMKPVMTLFPQPDSFLSHLATAAAGVRDS
jgi:hypothetical protein